MSLRYSLCLDSFHMSNNLNQYTKIYQYKLSHLSKFESDCTSFSVFCADLPFHDTLEANIFS